MRPDPFTSRDVSGGDLLLVLPAHVRHGSWAGWAILRVASRQRKPPSTLTLPRRNVPQFEQMGNATTCVGDSPPSLDGPEPYVSSA
jgi:hypothetical protein